MYNSTVLRLILSFAITVFVATMSTSQISPVDAWGCHTETGKPEVGVEFAWDEMIELSPAHYWAANVDIPGPLVALTFDLGGCYDVDEICIAFLKSHEREVEFAIAAADNEEGPYTNHFGPDWSGTSDEDVYECFDVNAIGQYFSIIGYGNSAGSGWVSILEVDIYGSPAACDGTSEDGDAIGVDDCDDGDCANGEESWSPEECDCIDNDPVGIIEGCVNPLSCNYDSAANCNDGSCMPVPTCNTDPCLGDIEVIDPADPCQCIVTESQVSGCMDINSCNYDPTANCDDGSCMPVPTCNTDPCLGDIEVIDPADPCQCIVTESQLNGCMDIAACNFDAGANCDDGSCIYVTDTCNTDPCLGDVEIPDPANTCNCIVDQPQMLGCMDITACNYDAGANCDDGSCFYTNTSCNTDICIGDIEVPDPADACNCIVDEVQVLGCMDINSCNYNPDANCDDGTCMPVPTCNTNICQGDIEIPDPAEPCNCIIDELQVLGCMDINSCNYNPDANCDDGSCQLVPDCNTDICAGDIEVQDPSNPCGCIPDVVQVLGCMDANSCNYNASANCDNGSCLSMPSCNTNICAGNTEVVDPSDPCNCVLDEVQVLGCMDINSCNYNASANCDDGSCLPMPSCNTDICAGDTEVVDPSDLCSCVLDEVQVLGCMDINSCNYDATANCDDGSCLPMPSCNTDICAGDTEVVDPSDPCSCVLDELQVLGCMDINSCNYDAMANCDDGSCLPMPSCNTDICAGDVEEVDPTNPCGCVTVEVQVLGCMDINSCNYDATANCDDGSCMPMPSCNTDICTGDVEEVDPTNPCGCVTVEVQVIGCMDVDACNYDVAANCDSGTCEYLPTFNTDICDGDVEMIDPADPCNLIVIEPQVFGCTNAESCNYDPLANCDNGSCIDSPICNTDICLGDIEVINPSDVCMCIVETIQVLGCTDPQADNYDPAANCDDGSCVTSGDVFLPNIISTYATFPNDVFMAPANPLVTDISCSVYDRWGNKVMDSYHPDLSTDQILWDAQCLGAKCEQGVYIYVVEYNRQGELIQRIGDITIVR